MKKIVIRVGESSFEGELNDSVTAGLIWDALPLEANGQTWGDEIYFRIPIEAEPESPVDVVEPGDLGYWPPGSAFCIFYGLTPASSGDRIVPASPVNIVGRMVSDVTVLSGTADPGRIRIDRGM
jgi:hypothetical protein